MTVQTAETTGTTLEQASQARTIQLALKASIAQDAAALWPLLDVKRLDETFPNWLRLMVALTERYHSLSSTAAGIFYGDTRETVLQVPTPADLIKTAPLPSENWMSNAYGFSGPGVLTNPDYEPSSGLTITQGTAQRIAQDGGRTTIQDTVKADPKAVGWYRVTDGKPCAFCALLASRKIAYKSEQSASFESHNDCGCTAAPAFSRDQELPAISHTADAIYRKQISRLPNSQRLPAFRKAWDAHLASN